MAEQVAEFRILGPLEVLARQHAVTLGGRKQKALLAILVIHHGEALSSDRLIDELWGEQPPPTAGKTLQVYVSNLRKAIGRDAIATNGGGYRFSASLEQIDAHRFEELCAQGRRALDDGDPATARALLKSALSLWRGEPLTDFGYEQFAQAEIVRLQEARITALADRLESELALGEHETAVAELEALVVRYPERERLLGLLMLALYRSGRQSDALAAYRQGQRALDDRLGLDPGPRLRELEQAILRQDPALQTPAERSPFAWAVHGQVRRGGLLIAAGGVILLAAAVMAAAVVVSRGSTKVGPVPNSVAAIDARTNGVVDHVRVGIRPGAIAVGSGSLWVANVDDRTVSRIDLRTRRTGRSFPISGSPTGLAATRTAVWVVSAKENAASVRVSRIDPRFEVVRPGARLGNIIPGAPGTIAADGERVWVAPSTGVVARLDAGTGRVAQRVDPNAAPDSIAVGGGAVWLTDSNADNVTRIDPGGALASVAVGHGPRAVAVGAGGVWVSDALDDALVRIDPQTQAVTTTIPVGRSPAGIAIGDGSVWVANSGDGTVTRIDPATNRAVATIAVGGSPQAIALVRGRAWVTIDAPAVTAIRVAKGGVARVDSPGDVESMDPALAYTDLAWQLLDATCARLLNYADKSSPAGSQLTAEVAESLPGRSADGRTYTFRIRDGFRFSPPSNEAVTAQTFKHAIERSLSPRMKSALAYQFNDIVGARAYMAGKASQIAGVAARGNRLTIRLVAPAPDLVTRISQPVFCAVPVGTPIAPEGLRAIPMAGPYYIASYAPGQGVVLKRNPNYRGSRPHALQRIELAVGVSGKRALADVAAGAADYALNAAPPAERARLAARYGPGSPAAARGAQRYFVSPMSQLWFLPLNTRRPLFRDARMRRAVNYAVDRTAIARHDFGSPLHPTDQYLPPAMPGYRDADVYPLKPDIARARQLAGGKRRTAIFYTCNESACDQQAQIVKKDLAAIGLDVEVRSFTFPALWTKLQHGSGYDIGFYGWESDYLDPRDFLNFLLEGGSQLPKLDDPVFRRRLKRAATLSGPPRYLSYGALDVDLARNAAPWVALANMSRHDFFSARIGCQAYRPYGIDLAGLCIRKAQK